MASHVQAAASIWLNVWERAAGLSPAARADELLRPILAANESAPAAVGARDLLLLELRGALFGHELACTTACPQCGERCEWECALAALHAAPASASGVSTLDVRDGPWHARIRLVTAADLAAVADCGDETAAVRGLLERCVLAVTRHGEAAHVSQLPESMIGAISATMAGADPQAASVIALSCPACAHRWDAAFDVGAYLWTELDTWAQHTLSDVHVLASRYGWNEAEILALSAARRARYLAMVLA
jgi:hypothetical protein